MKLAPIYRGEFHLAIKNKLLTDEATNYCHR